VEIADPQCLKFWD